MLRLKIKEIELQNIRDKEASELFLKREIFSKEYLKFLGFIKKIKWEEKISHLTALKEDRTLSLKNPVEDFYILCYTEFNLLMKGCEVSLPKFKLGLQGSLGFSTLVIISQSYFLWL